MTRGEKDHKMIKKLQLPTQENDLPLAQGLSHVYPQACKEYNKGGIHLSLSAWNGEFGP